jgi:hypothetical protein
MTTRGIAGRVSDSVNDERADDRVCGTAVRGDETPGGSVRPVR